jgi:hypothetical protein
LLLSDKIMSLYINKGREEEEVALKQLLDNLRGREIWHMQEEAFSTISMFNYTVVFVEENFARKM